MFENNLINEKMEITLVNNKGELVFDYIVGEEEFIIKDGYEARVEKIETEK